MNPELKFIRRLEKNAQKGLNKEIRIEKATGIYKINFPMNKKVRIPK